SRATSGRRKGVSRSHSCSPTTATGRKSAARADMIWYARASAALLLSIALVACTPRVTLTDARQTAADAQALMKQAIELQKAGHEKEAAETGRRAEEQLAEARNKYLSARA